MKFFEQLNLPAFPNLLSDLNRLLDSELIKWGKNKQICINTTNENPDDFALGTGSLDHDWSNSYTVVENGISKIVVPKKEHPLSDCDFINLCSQFKNTEFENLYNIIKTEFNVGRIRIMKSEPKTCLSWHVDHSRRLHYPITTQEGCFMVIDDEVLHLPKDTWWITDTTKLHTAFNASKESRIHLVVCLID